ncbi:hypothetical protein [Pseudodesulfovibrio sp.]|uniref:hypothetical protein n=1 Tax=unclassified Pseudodesulfovibrio TaxID=2661612 RepID=UPI003B00BA65
MRKHFTFLLLALMAMILTACGPSLHQPTPVMPLPEVPKPGQRLQALEERLHLSEAQTTAIRPIIEDEYTRKTKLVKELEADSSRNRRQELEDLDWSVIKQLSNYLDRNQLNEYCNILDEDAKSGKPAGTKPDDPGGVHGRIGGGSGPAPGDASRNF